MTNIQLGAKARDIAGQLEKWEGEYHYPHGLLEEGSRIIWDLLEEVNQLEGQVRKLENKVTDLGWMINQDGMGR